MPGRVGQGLSKEHRKKISETSKKNRPRRTTVCPHVDLRATGNGLCQQCYTRYIKYNITPAEFQALLIKQHGGCAICGGKGSGRQLDVDHCHTTNKVRGLLCNNCNRGIGHLKDDPALLRLAATYLER